MAHKDPEVRRRYHREFMRRWREKYPGIGQAYRYGISVHQLYGMMHAQDGKCAICGTPFGDRTPLVDHHHPTGKVRGLLCHRCNTGLGHIERKGFVEKARKYLRERR